MRHPIRELLIGPLVAPIAYWIGVIAAAWIRDVRLGWFQALRELAVIAAFGAPIAYTAALVWGAPILYALRRLGWGFSGGSRLTDPIRGHRVSTVLVSHAALA